jgi:hypothetical protein
VKDSQAVRTSAATPLLACVVLAAGCGGSGTKSNGESGKTAQQVLTDARNAAEGASAVHVAGSISSNGSAITLDIHVTNGKGGKGTLAEQGLSFQLVRVGDKVYVKGSDAFYKQVAGPAAAALLHDKWLQGSATTGQFASLAELTDIAKLFDAALGSPGKLENDGETTYKGQKVVAIKDASKKGTLYVAATGTPYPVAIVGASSGNSGAVTFGNWNESVSVSAPKGAVDLGSIGG